MAPRPAAFYRDLMSHRMIPVELVADDVPAALGAPTAGPDGHAPHRGGLWGAGAVVVAAAVLLAGQAVVDAREREHDARLAAVPGVLSPLEGDLAELWHLPPERAAAVRSENVVAGVLVGGGPGTTTQFLLHGVDAATGREAWATGVRSPVQGTSSYIVCEPVGDADGVLALCIGRGFDGPGGAPTRALWTVDARDGTVLAVRQELAAAVTAARGLVLVGARVAPTDAAAQWSLTATEPVTGDVRWRYVTPPTDTRADPDYLSPVPTVTTLDDGYVLAWGPHAWRLDDAGTLVTALTVRSADDRWFAARSGAAVAAGSQSGRPGSATLVLRTGERIGTVGRPAELTVDDGSVPDLVLTGGSGVLEARDAATGELEWQLRRSVMSAVLLEGTLYAGTSDGVIALDARTGSELWHAQLGQAAQQVSTDGRRLAVVRPDGGLRLLWRADGSPAGSARLPASYRDGSPRVQQAVFVRTLDDVVLRLADGSVALLGGSGA